MYFILILFDNTRTLLVNIFFHLNIKFDNFFLVKIFDFENIRFDFENLFLNCFYSIFNHLLIFIWDANFL